MKSSDYELIESVVENCNGSSSSTNTAALILTSQRDELAKSYFDIIKEIGEDPNRDGLIKTPYRAADAILHFTKGYRQNLNGWSFIYKSFSFYYYYYNLFQNLYDQIERSGSRCNF
jgi:hypothetical protein